MFEHLFAAFGTVFTVKNLAGLLAGTVVGYFVGAMPGLTPSIGIALLIPFTFGMDPVMSMILLVSLYMAAEYGGGITAILLNAPGTPAAAATAFDGYPLAKSGQAGKALTISILSSGFGAFFSTVLLIATAVPLAGMALAFGPSEYFALAVFGLSLVSSLGGKSLLKGFLAMVIGLLAVTIGLDPINGIPRYAFTVDLFEGIPFLPALIGLFALSEVLYMLEDVREKPVEPAPLHGLGVDLNFFRQRWLTLIRSPLIGYIIGVIPGAGATIASLVSYNEARRVSREKDLFGKGNPEGIMASEAANNSAVSGALAPLLALGVPGSASTAILIGALTIQGVQPGPLLFTKNPEIPYSIFASLLISVPLMVAIGLGGARIWMKVTNIPKSLLATIVAGICVLGAYANSNSMYPVWVMIICGILGYILRKIDIPMAPVVLALVLGFMMEVNFRRALITSGGDLSIFFSHPITVVLLVAALLTLITPIIQEIRKNRVKSR
ncbi:MAG: tripartite tricarboxylate transporter permease [Bacillota bacterium]